jgi:hypothetical protein
MSEADDALQLAQAWAVPCFCILPHKIERSVSVEQKKAISPRQLSRCTHRRLVADIGVPLFETDPELPGHRLMFVSLFVSVQALLSAASAAYSASAPWLHRRTVSVRSARGSV